MSREEHARHLECLDADIDETCAKLREMRHDRDCTKAWLEGYEAGYGKGWDEGWRDCAADLGVPPTRNSEAAEGGSPTESGPELHINRPGETADNASDSNEAPANEGGDHEVVSTIPESDFPKQGAAGGATTTASPAVADPLGEFRELVEEIEGCAGNGALKSELVDSGFDGNLIGRACLAGALTCANSDDGIRIFVPRKEAA